jgi:hypothetical protein
MRKLGFDPDPWQIDVLEGGHKRLLLNCSRQAGKSTVVALLSLVEALMWRNAVILLLSRSHRQSTELFRIVSDFYKRLGEPDKVSLTTHELETTNHCRIISLPCQADTIRGYSRVHMLVIDEAARVPDDLYRSVRPMLAVSGGRLICLSTPYGKRGFFYEAWANGGDDWTRMEVPAEKISRITPEFLKEERRAMGSSWFRQEYCCSFEALEGLVYPEFKRCLVYGREPPTGKKVGGIDFGLRNPFAAVWGVLDRDDVLWITGEHYEREKPLSYHVRHLPRDVTWYADPEGAREICELRCAGFTILKGDNAKKPGIGAVQARVEDGSLKVLAGRCPNLIFESELYHYDPEDRRKSEDPVKDHDHALDALRYLVYKLDARRLGKKKWWQRYGKGTTTEPAKPKSKRPWLSIWNEALWTAID